MRVLAVLGAVLLVLVCGAAAYLFLGYYDISASTPHAPAVRWTLETAMERSVSRHAADEVATVPALDDPEMLRTGGRHFAEEGCIGCHGGPGVGPAEFARHMRPEPPDLARAAARFSDAELYWIMKHGIRMTGMPAFGPTHQDDELWALVAFVRRLPEMPPARFQELTASPRPGSGHGETPREP